MRRAFAPLGEEVTHGPVERARHAHGFTGARDQSERALNGIHVRGGAVEKESAGLLDSEVIDPVGVMVRQINYAFDVAIHDFVKRSGPVKFVRALSGSIRHLTRTSQQRAARLQPV